MGSHLPSGYCISGTLMLSASPLPSAPCSRASAHKDSPREPAGFRGAALWCRMARRMPWAGTASTLCPLLPAATPPSQLSPCSRGRCCCRDINIIFWGLTAKCTGAAKLQEWLCWSRLKVELSQQPTCRAGHQQIPWAAISTCTQAGFYKPYKRNRIYFEFHTRETILCPFTPEALVCTKNVCSPSDTNTPNVALVCSGNCYSSFHLGRNKLRNKTERNVKELRATSRICVVWPDVPAHCPGSVNLWIIFWQF